MISAELQAKRNRLHSVLRAFDHVAIAYSGGVDSAYLAWEAHQVLGSRMEAVIADSPSLARRELRAAIAFAAEHKISLRIVHTQEMQRPEYLRNDAARCFHCKDELFSLMQSLQQHTSIAIAYGRNLDDIGGERPGQRAAEMRGVHAPLVEAGLGKHDIRELARASGLALWDKPAAPCLSSRLQPGLAVTEQALAQIEGAEDRILALGFRQVRVRHHGELARIEFDQTELHRALTQPMFQRISEAAHHAGFRWVALDMDGYRSGSTSALLPVAELLATGSSSR